MPTKSVWPICGFAAASFHSGDPAPNTRVMSPVAEVDAFSNSMFAVPTPPTSQPARVNGTHGAGVFLPPVVTMFGSGSPTGSTALVQYLNELENVGTLLAGK